MRLPIVVSIEAVLPSDNYTHLNLDPRKMYEISLILFHDHRRRRDVKSALPPVFVNTSILTQIVHCRLFGELGTASFAILVCRVSSGQLLLHLSQPLLYMIQVNFGEGHVPVCVRHVLTVILSCGTIIFPQQEMQFWRIRVSY